MLKLFAEYLNGGDIFKRLFVLYVVMVLTPLPAHRLRKNLFTVVEDTSTICEYDWCSYVLNVLFDSIYKVLNVVFSIN